MKRSYNEVVCGSREHSILERISSMTYKMSDNSTMSFLDNLIQCLPGFAHLKSGADYSYLLANRATLALYGIQSEGGIFGKNVYDISVKMAEKWPKKYANQIQAIDEEIVYHKKPLIALSEKPYLSAEGKIIINSLSKIPLFNVRGEVAAIFTFAMDQAHHKNLEEIRQLYKKFYSSPSDAHKSFLKYIGLDKYIKHKRNTISERELDCLVVYCKGRAIKQIARELELSHRTVESYLETIKIKLGCHNKVEMVDIFFSTYFKMYNDSQER